MWGKRDRAILELLFATGGRISEVLNLKPEDINLNGSYLILYGKRKKERVVPFGDPAKAAAALKAAQPVLMRTAQKGVIHKRSAARKISRLTKRVKSLSV